MGYDFAQGVDPKEFILSSKRHFLHALKPYTLLLQDETSDRKVLAVNRVGAAKIGQYNLVLSCCRGRMPSAEAEELLGAVVGCMDKTYEGRQTLGRHMAPVIDRLALAYLELVHHLEREDIGSN
ncbi:MAG: hypothetical protein AABX14_03845 [Candidatus Aenigmatarchaeota archaeon]